MAAKTKRTTAKPGLHLFLRKLDFKKAPAPDATLVRRQIKRDKKIAADIERLERDLSEIDAAAWRAKIEGTGLTIGTLKEAKKRGSELSSSRQALIQSFAYGGPYDVAIPGQVVVGGLCRDVIIQECQERVCVDQPVPLDVDLGWATPGTDGALRWPRQFDRFELRDSVRGGDSWNWTYHRITHTHDGEVNFRVGAELVEDATVRSAGVRFVPLPGGTYGGQYYPGYNGAWADGRNFAVLPTNWGRAQQWSSFQVSSLRPGATWDPHVPWSQVRVLYKDTGEIGSRVSSSGPYSPPEREAQIGEAFRAGTQFLIDVSLSYHLIGSGLDGSASVDYLLEVQPYLNFEACSWQWPS